MTVRPRLAVPALVLGVALLAACTAEPEPTDGGSTEPSAAADTPTTEAEPSPTPEVDELHGSLAHLIPDGLGEQPLPTGVADDGWPHALVNEDGDPTGVLLDLATTAAGRLGLELDLEPGEAIDIAGAVEEGDYAVGLVPIGLSEHLPDTVDFVSYLVAGTTFVVRPGTALDTDPESLCGRTVGHREPSEHDDGGVKALSEFDAVCSARGLEPVDLVPQPGDEAIRNGVLDGSLDAGTANQARGAYVIDRDGLDLELAGPVFERTATSFMVAREGSGAEELGEAFAAAVNEMIADGSYARILDSYGLAHTAVEEAELNLTQESS